MDIFHFLLKEATVIVIKAFAKAWAKDFIRRHKKGTAPTVNRDGSEETN